MNSISSAGTGILWINEMSDDENIQNFIVGIGASAGGVEAIQSFFSTVKKAEHLCYIVFLHCDPHQKNIIKELISKQTLIPTVNITTGLALKSGVIYIVPENCDIKIQRNRFKVIGANYQSCTRDPIDNLFIQLAINYGKYAIGVILSGTGNDGSIGIINIKKHNGIVAVQALDDAICDDMPNNASLLQPCDVIAPANKINNALVQLIDSKQEKLLTNNEEELESLLVCIFSLLKQTTSHDFSCYKRKTLLRRIKRRMTITNKENIYEYIALLRQQEAEQFKLMAELLIGVTRFFRDHQVWKTLKHDILPLLLNRKNTDSPFRAWVAGCASGEEVFSLAFLLFDLQHANEHYKNIKIQLFATDLDQQAITFARKGLYPKKITQQFTQAQLSRYFETDIEGYYIKKDIRDLIVFAPHNLLSDPPFTKLDLICCRNVMIYLSLEIHQQLFEKFHYSLNDQGYLLLGSAESISNLNFYFTLINNKMPIYQCNTLISDKKTIPLITQISSFKNITTKPRNTMTKKQPNDLQQHFVEHIEHHYTPSAILINQQGDILNIYGDTSPYLAPVPGKAEWNIQTMAKESVKSAIQEAFHQCQEKNTFIETIVSLNTKTQPTDNFLYVLIKVEPFKHPTINNLWLLAFEQFNTQIVLPSLTVEDVDQRHQFRIHFLENSLQQIQLEMQDTKEEMQTSREELMSTNEELQSTNEELTTSTEELRTTNEQLIQSRQHAEQSLVKYTDLFDSAPVGYFTLNCQGKILNVNTAGKKLLAESNDDHIGSRLSLYVVEQDRQHFTEHLELAYKENKPQKCEVSLWHDGVDLRHVTVNISSPNNQDKCRVIIDDITKSKQQQQQLKENEARYARVLSGTNDGIWEWDIIEDQTYISPRCEQLLGYSVREIHEQRDIFTSRIHHDDKVQFISDITQHIEHHCVFDLELRLKTKQNNYRWFRCKAEAIRNEKNIATILSGTLSDIHQRKLLQHQDKNKNKILQLTAQNAPLNSILLAIVNLIEQDNPQMICSILLLDESKKHLYNCIGSRLPSFYKEALEGVAIGKNVGSCGTAAALKKRIIVENISTDPLWKNFKDLAKQANLGSCWSQPLFDDKNNVLGTFAIYHQQPTKPSQDDISLITHHAILAEIAIDHFHNMKKIKMAALVFDNSSEASMIFDKHDTVLAINPAFTGITGYSADEIIGKKRFILHSEKQNRAFYQTKSEIIEKTGHWQGELWGKHKNGQDYAQWITINTIYDESGGAEKRISLFFDITEKKRSEKIIWDQANFDNLTGLPNRRMFFERLKHEIKRAEREQQKFAVLLIDLDNFKEVNDAYGHDQGDMLLIKVAKIISACVRTSDTVARLGGDEFTVILNDIKEDLDIEKMAKNIVTQLQQPVELENELVYVSASIGITVCPDDSNKSETLLKSADQAMYQAKENGKNSFYFFTSEMQYAAEKRLSLLNDLRQAINNHEFSLYFQPIVESKSNRITKAEVLVRWIHPEKGMISPDAFISLAEKSGLIIELGDWIFKTAVQQMKKWQQTIGNQIPLSINVSPIQFLHHSNVIQQWLSYLKTENITLHNINIEITEGLLLDANSLVNEQLKLLAKNNISVSIDDFGTGYSSLSYLKKFDIDYLKIDQSFVENLDSDTNNQAICQAIIVMAHQLGMKVIAEGVETVQQSEYLIQAGCDYMQGYLVAKPLPNAEFEQFFLSHNVTIEKLSKLN